VIFLQISTLFWIDGRITSLSYWIGINDVRQFEMHTPDPLIPRPNPRLKLLKIYKSPHIDQIAAE
jgi:hypothetical protein